MADENGPGVMSKTQELTCVRPECGKQFVVKVPTGAIINHVICSMMVVTHPEPEYCPYCGQGYLWQLAAVGQVKSLWQAVETKSSAIIAPPPGMRVS